MEAELFAKKLKLIKDLVSFVNAGATREMKDLVPLLIQEFPEYKIKANGPYYRAIDREWQSSSGNLSWSKTPTGAVRAIKTRCRSGELFLYETDSASGVDSSSLLEVISFYCRDFFEVSILEHILEEMEVLLTEFNSPRLVYRGKREEFSELDLAGEIT